MFQIETALLKFDNIDEDQMERTSVVKRRVPEICAWSFALSE